VFIKANVRLKAGHERKMCVPVRYQALMR